MTDSTSDVISIDSCRELMGAEADGEEQVAAVRDHADAMAHFIVDVVPRTTGGRRQDDDASGVDDAGSIPAWFQTRHRFESTS